MGLTKRKPNPEETMDSKLHAAHAELARIVDAIAGAARDRDLALLDEDRAGVERAEAGVTSLEKDRERAERRIALLKEKAADELRRRQEKAQADLIERSAADFRERDATQPKWSSTCRR